MEVRVDGATQFLAARRNSDDSRMPDGLRRVDAEDAVRGAIPGGDAGLALLEGVGYAGQALEGIGVAPGCDIGVGDVVRAPERLLRPEHARFRRRRRRRRANDR